MDELRAALHELGTTLTEAVGQARRAGYLARRLGVAQVDQEADCSKVRGHCCARTTYEVALRVLGRYLA